MSRTKFQSMHELKYALKVMHVDPSSKLVQSVRCQFCVYFGREEEIGQKRARKQTARIKTWESFRPELYEAHHAGQHRGQWTIYKSLDSEDKKRFFDNVSAHANSLESHFGPKEPSILYNVKTTIVEVVIGGLFFNPEEQGGFSQTRALSLFEPEKDENQTLLSYSVTIKNALQFRLVAKYLSHGLSFSQVSNVLLATKELTGVGKIGSVSHGKVSDFARVVVAVNLTSIHNILESSDVLGYSLALDSSTHQGVSYSSMRIRVHYKNSLLNLHLAAVPMFDRHTAINIFNLTVKFLDAVSPSWRRKLIGIASDGANVMTGRIGGVVTLLENEAEFPVHRTWCMLHQIDLVAKECLNSLYQGEFMSLVNKLASNLRKQETLIREMGSKCPKMTTRWLAMGSWSQWQLNHYEELEAFFSERRANQPKPTEWYWSVVAAVYGLFDHVNISIRTLQGRQLLMTEQQKEIDRLIECIKSTTDAEQPLMELMPADNVTCGNWSISLESVAGFLDDQGLWVHEAVNSLAEDAALLLKQEVGRMIVHLLDGISRISTLRDSQNRPIEEAFPSVVPAYLCKLRGRDFIPMLQTYRDRFSNVMKQITSEQIELFKAYQNESSLKTAIDQCQESGFEKSWSIVEGRFPILRAFAGALFTVFPNTSAVESDFSVLGWEKDEHRDSLSDLSLEGIMQAKQFEQLQKMK